MHRFRTAIAGFASTLALAAACVVPALADGSLTIKNATIDQPVMVEVRVGTTQEDSSLYARQPIEHGKTLVVDSTNLQVFWRRQVTPGVDDKWTDWQRVDVRNGDESVQF